MTSLTPNVNASREATVPLYLLVARFIEYVYVACCDADIFDASGAAAEDGWGVVIAAQTLAYHIIATLENAEKLVTDCDFSAVADLPMPHRQAIAACVVLSMKFQKRTGLTKYINSGLSTEYMSGQAGIYYIFFFNATERQRVDAAIQLTNGTARYAMDQMRNVVDDCMVEVLRRVGNAFQLMARSVGACAEECLWDLSKPAEEGAAELKTARELEQARAVATFLMRAAAFSKPSLVYQTDTDASNVAVGRALALAGVCLVTGRPVRSRALATEKTRQLAITLAQTALGVPAYAALYSRSYARGNRWYFLVCPKALCVLLSTLRIAQRAA